MTKLFRFGAVFLIAMFSAFVAEAQFSKVNVEGTMWTGSGSPVGRLSAKAGVTYVDTATGNFYAKKSGSDSSSWVLVGVSSGAISEWVNPEQYGAATDGTTDCGVAFTNALAYVAANRGVGLQLVCTNGYHFNQPLYVPSLSTIAGRNYVREGGNGSFTFGTPDMKFDRDGLIIANQSGVRLLNLSIRGTTAATGGLTNGATGVSFSSSDENNAVAFLYIDNCNVYRFGGAGIYLTNTDEVTIRSSSISDNQDGIVIGGYSANTVLESLNIGGGQGTVSSGTYNRSCLDISQGRNVTIIGGDMGNTTNTIIKIHSGARVLISGANIENNTSATAPIIQVDQSYLNLYNTHIVRGTASASISNYNSSIWLELCNFSTSLASPDIVSGSDPVDTILSPYSYTYTNTAHTVAFAASDWPVDYGSGATYARGQVRVDRSDSTTDSLIWRGVERGTSIDVPLNYYYLQWFVDKSYSDPAMSLTVGPLVANGPGVTNILSVNVRSQTNVAPANVTIGTTAPDLWETNIINGTTYFRPWWKAH